MESYSQKAQVQDQTQVQIASVLKDIPVLIKRYI